MDLIETCLQREIEICPNCRVGGDRRSKADIAVIGKGKRKSWHNRDSVVAQEAFCGKNSLPSGWTLGTGGTRRALRTGKSLRTSGTSESLDTLGAGGTSVAFRSS
jgi:hypothetical protein